MRINLSLAGLIVALVQICLPPPTFTAENGVADEYRVKGAYLLRFTQFVEWPARSFKGASDPVSICIVGQDPFGPAFATAARDTSAFNRPIVVRQISDGQQVDQCQILFVNGAEKKRARALLEKVAGGSVLTVGESDDFLAKGGVVDFKIEGERVRVEINTAAAERAGLHISAKLLSLAKTAPEPAKEKH